MSSNWKSINITIYIAKYIPFLYMVFVTIWLRIVNLGYSDYQGDEIKALCVSTQRLELMNCLSAQRRGPVQFLVTFLVSLFDSDHSNEFFNRLPFALTAILAIIVFYLLVDLHFGKKVALYATLFISVNGIFVGLTRIIQYQPFVLFFSFSALYVFSLATISDRWRIAGLYVGMLLWAAAFLAHYDAIFIAPFVIYLLYRWFNQYRELTSATKLKHILISSSLCLILTASFYLPMIFSATMDTQDYWASRLTDTNEDTKPASSLLTFQVYNPLLVVYLYMIFGLFSLADIKKLVPLLVWFLVPWIILEIIIYEPGTHIYTYLIPASILIAFGLVNIERLIHRLGGQKYGKALRFLGVSMLFVFLASLSHFLFIDHTPEYPWGRRKYLFWMIERPSREYQVRFFGFPYYRNWEEIREFVSATDDIQYYMTNEKKSITDFYVPQEFNLNGAGYYIHIYEPQSFTEEVAKKKIRYWTEKYDPIKVYEINGRVMVEIYNMPPGSVKDLERAGY